LYDEAIRLGPEFPIAYVNRGEAKAVLGLKREAREDFETALGLARSASDVNLEAQIEQLLRDLDEE